ncbi:hypothetical protein [Actinomadura spongiicola]|nr:hypothetical protein [Actinomadura spongiicola]
MNAHAVSDAREPTVTRSDGRTAPARVVGSDTAGETVAGAPV